MQILTLTEGMAGMESQVKGLANAVSSLTGWKVENRQAQAKAPWCWLPAGVCPLPQFSLPAHQKLSAPWPKLLITCGRRSFPYAAMVAQKSKGQTFTVHIQAPDSGLNKVNLIVAPMHDATTGPNVIQTLGAVHHLTRENLATAAKIW
ncbi:MAG: hypothetical protein EBR79_01920, partial [Proteobacteria bacterium]|nr:hypothetical protein [Pseudomonadota bacterium]